MLHKNTIITGIFLGLILPAISVLIFDFIIKDGYMLMRRGMPYFITVGLNLLVLRYFAAKGQEHTARGMMLVSFVFMILVYFFRFR